MADFLNTSLSGLQASQRALATVANNIANAATEGYSRQRVNSATRPAEFTGVGYIGTGVQVTGIERSYDAFLAGEVRSGTAETSRLDVFSRLAGRVGDLLGSDSTGLSNGLQAFFDGLQGLANDPASLPARQSLLGQAGTLEQRINSLDTQLSTIGREVEGRIDGAVTEINSLARAIADTNEAIAASPGAANGAFPNELLDQRDRLLRELSSQIEVNAVPAELGRVNVFVGSGQSLVLGDDAVTLTAANGPFGPAQREISVGGSVITGQLRGGTLGGLLDFRREVLEPSRNELGRIAVGLTEAFNSQQRLGLDLNGNFGGDFFAVGGPDVFAATGNTGTASVTATVASAAGLTGDDYQLQYDGALYSLVNLRSGQNVALGGTGTPGDPLVADGLSIVVSGSPNAGDRFQLQPTRSAATGFSRLIDDPEGIAAAAPVRTSASLGNLGDAEVSAGSLDNPAVLPPAPVTIAFDSATTYQVNGVGPSLPYTSGATIVAGGFQLQISGTPAAGDSFSAAPNTSGVGDNRNALALASLRDAGVLAGGQRSLLDQADLLLTEVGSATAAAQTAFESQSALLQGSEAALQSVSGVNLEEEAANLLRFQQAFQANARVIQTASTTFQSLLAAFR